MTEQEQALPARRPRMPLFDARLRGNRSDKYGLAAHPELKAKHHAAQTLHRHALL